MASSLNAQTVTPTNVPVNNTLKYALDTGYQLTGKALVGEHNLQYTHVFDESFKLAVQGDFFTNYLHDHNTKEWTTYLKERYLRVKFIGSPFINILGFKTGWEVRYFLPIDQKSHQAGSFGNVQTSLLMSKQFNSHFNLTISPKFVLGLHQRSYQLYGSQKENDLVILALEFVPQWVITPGFTLSYDPTIWVTAKGATPTKKSTTYTYNYRHDLELLYTLKNFYNVGVGAVWQLDSYEFGNGSHNNKLQNDLFKGTRNLVGLRFLKTFDL